MFFANDNIEPEFAFDPETISDKSQERIRASDFSSSAVVVRARNGQNATILLISQKQARQAYKANIWGAERLFISDSGLIFEGDTLRLQNRDPQAMSVLVYPQPPALNLKSEAEGMFARFSLKPETRSVTAEWKRIKAAGPAPEIKKDKKGGAIVPDDSAFEGGEVWEIAVPKDALNGAHETYLKIHYTGDIARAYIGDRLIDDDFYFGRPWEIGLRRFAPEVLEKGITLKILPLRKDAPIYIPRDRLPQFGENGESIGVSDISIAQDYEVTLQP